MPYLLTPGNQPGSPTSWVKMDPASGGGDPTHQNGTDGAAGTMTPPPAGAMGPNIINGKMSGRMTTGRPLPRPLPPIVSSGAAGAAPSIRNYSNYVAMSDRGGIMTSLHSAK